MSDTMKLVAPETNVTLFPGVRVKLSRFDSVVWVVSFGWYTCNGNRPVCGWYLTSVGPVSQVKPLHKTDLDDIYIVEY